MKGLGVCLIIVAGASLASAQGRLIVCGDEWSLSDYAFTNNAASTNAFANNVAQQLIGSSGSILRKSNNGLFNGTTLATTLTTAGYSFTTDTSTTFTLAQLQAYDAVFLAGAIGRADVAANLTALTTYIVGGGSVYLACGTGDFGNAAAESAAWNSLTSLYGISIGGAWIDPSSTLNVTVDAGVHPLHAGVTTFTYGWGHDISVTSGATVALRGGPELSQNIGLVAMTNSPVPEPITMALGTMGLGAAYRRRRASRKQS
ncbi:MAG: PEP-CTERM sorting domain-containing protein [Fimbriimonadaceae bacterium]|nr:PEP-CTERM sorting domain-containing protein [Chthonomonadaceae bacterium]MCO5297243.1 PEP-CTERM sorting domain-containing protein [Fimbriimonadaceae bacterium]